MSQFASLEGQSVIIESTMDDVLMEGLLDNSIIKTFVSMAQELYKRILEFIDWAKEKIQGIKSVSSPEVIKQIGERTVDMYLTKKNKAIVDKALAEFNRIESKYDQAMNSVLKKIKTTNHDGILPLLSHIGDLAGELSKNVYDKLKDIEEGGLVNAPASDLKDLTSIHSEFDIIKDCGKSIDEAAKNVEDMNRGMFASVHKFVSKQRSCILILITLYTHDLKAYDSLMNGTVAS